MRCTGLCIRAFQLSRALADRRSVHSRAMESTSCARAPQLFGTLTLRLSDTLWQPLRRSEALKTSVASWIVGHPVLPHPKDYPHPCTPQDADSVGVIAASFPCSSVDVLRPPVVMARALGQSRQRFPQALVARPAEPSHLALAGLDGYRAHACVGGHSLVGRVALPSVPDLR